MKRLLYFLSALFLVSEFAYTETLQSPTGAGPEAIRLFDGTVWIVQGANDKQSMNMKPSLMETTSKNSDGVYRIDAGQLQAALADKNFTLINVHIPYEGELPQTDYRIPYNKIEQNIDKLPDKNQTLVVYCRSGSMSTAAAGTLISLGYTKVIELKGGFNAWKRAGYPFNLTR